MRKSLISLIILISFPLLVAAGFNFGFIKGVKKKVDQVDEKVEIKKAEIALQNTPAPAPNNAPILSWTNEAPVYASDGLNPETGDLDTSFIYHIKYTDVDNDAPASGYPKIHIKKNGTEISGSPFAMIYSGGTYNIGTIYGYATLLPTGTDYVYYFEARDSKNAEASGSPTPQISAPNVAAWTTQDIDICSSGGISFNGSLKLNSNGYPGIVYECAGPSAILKYANWNGIIWSTQTVQDSSIHLAAISLAFDSADDAHISYKADNSLKYAKWTGITWSTQTVEYSNAYGDYSSIALDNNSLPSIAYSGWDGISQGLKYANWTTSWSTQTIYSNYSRWMSLKLDSNNLPKIAYAGTGISTPFYDLKYATWNGSIWTNQTLDLNLIGYPVSLELDSNEYPHIAYSTQSAYGPVLIYTNWDGNSWNTQAIELATPEGLSLSLDSNGYPHILYYDTASTKKLKYAKWDGNAWQIETLLSDETVTIISLVIDSNNIPHIAYIVNGNLKYKKQIP